MATAERASRGRFEAMLPFIFRWECVRDHQGNVIAECDPADPGGVTKFGIDLRSHPELGEAGIRYLTQERATEIYWRGYWLKNGCDRLAKPLGEVYFNACVNCGRGRAEKLLGAVSGKTEARKAAAFLDGQAAFYERLAGEKPAMRKFLRGWLNRTADLRRWLGV